MDNDQKRQIYDCRLGQWQIDAQLQWQVVSVFFVPHTILIAVIASSLENQPFTELNSPAAILAMIGFALCVPWWSTFARMDVWWQVRKKLVYEAEKIWGSIYKLRLYRRPRCPSMQEWTSEPQPTL